MNTLQRFLAGALAACLLLRIVRRRATVEQRSAARIVRDSLTLALDLAEEHASLAIEAAVCAGALAAWMTARVDVGIAVLTTGVIAYGAFLATRPRRPSGLVKASLCRALAIGAASGSPLDRTLDAALPWLDRSRAGDWIESRFDPWIAAGLARWPAEDGSGARRMGHYFLALARWFEECASRSTRRRGGLRELSTSALVVVAVGAVLLAGNARSCGLPTRVLGGFDLMDIVFGGWLAGLWLQAQLRLSWSRPPREAREDFAAALWIYLSTRGPEGGRSDPSGAPSPSLDPFGLPMPAEIERTLARMPPARVRFPREAALSVVREIARAGSLDREAAFLDVGDVLVERSLMRIAEDEQRKLLTRIAPVVHAYVPFVLGFLAMAPVFRLAEVIARVAR